MADQKQVVLYGALAKNQASYNAGGALVAGTDGQWLLEPFDATIDYLHDGARLALAPGTVASFKRLAPSGIIVSGSPKIEARGRGAAYSASVFPPDMHVFMRASGHSATFSGGAGAEQIQYDPQALNDSSWGSLVMEGY